MPLRMVVAMPFLWDILWSVRNLAHNDRAHLVSQWAQGIVPHRRGLAEGVRM